MKVIDKRVKNSEDFTDETDSHLNDDDKEMIKLERKLNKIKEEKEKAFAKLGKKIWNKYKTVNYESVMEKIKNEIVNENNLQSKKGFSQQEEQTEFRLFLDQSQVEYLKSLVNKLDLWQQNNLDNSSINYKRFYPELNDFIRAIFEKNGISIEMKSEEKKTLKSSVNKPKYFI